MEFNHQTKRPLVRIGMLQSEEKMSFTALVPFDLLDSSGQVVYTAAAGGTYEVTLAQSQPAISSPMIRLAIEYNRKEAQQQIQRLEKDGLILQMMQVGENSQIGEERYIDNREYWVLATGFASLKEAECRRRQLPDFGSYQVFSIQKQPATGQLQVAGLKVTNGIRLQPKTDAPFSFSLHNIRVGIGFHWEHRESQNLEYILEFHIDKKGLITAVNVLDMEHYLASVNSSEMVADCSLEFLKAQTTVARCTVFATANKHHYGDPFDICADDHCQCFHGSGAIKPKSLQAAEETLGQILLYDGRICDTRYAKVCGAIGETYQNVWDDRHLAYLDKFYDGLDQRQTFQTVENEEAIRPFIAASPDVFCNPQKHPVPPHLNYAHQYFRWQVSHTAKEWGEIVASKFIRDLGPIRDIIPLKRGYSGRLIYIKMVGDLGEAVVGKELEIRRLLSPSHLYSSCFYVEKATDEQGNALRLTLHGAGWGHGVGLCQVGAAVMGEEGYPCAQILKHYYETALLKKIY